MARIFMAGAEIDPTTLGPVVSSPERAGSPDSPYQWVVTTGGGSLTRDTTVVRSGSASYKVVGGQAGVAGIRFGWKTGTGVAADQASKTFYARGAVRFPNIYLGGSAGAGTARQAIFVDDHIANAEPTICWTDDGKLRLQAGLSDQGSPFSISADTWYVIEVKSQYDANSHLIAAEFRVDGNSIASWTGDVAGLGPGSGQNFMAWGLLTCASNANDVVYFDDLAINDEAGSVNNSWCGNGKVILMTPTSDNARGAWTAGAGGTTNLWDAINNTPPAGVAEASATNTSQMKNRTTTVPTSYDGNLPSYTAAGIGANDVIVAIQIHECDGEDPATGTKTGAASMVSNPAISEGSAINFGEDLGLQGTYAASGMGNWRWHSTSIAQQPSVTKGTAPVIRMRNISGATGSRSASCCFLGAYVEYQTPVVPVIAEIPMRRIAV